MLIDWSGRHKDDAGVMGLYLRVRYDGLEVGFEFIKGNMLLVGSVWQRCIVGAKEDSLGCLVEELTQDRESSWYHEAYPGLVWRGYDSRKDLESLTSIVPAL